MKKKIWKYIKGSIKGITIAVASNGIANYLTLGNIQPINIVVGLIVGGILGFMFS